MKVLRISGDAESICRNLDCIAVSPDSAESMEELELACHLANVSFENGTNIGKKLKYEFLLWLSGTRDIKSAIKKTSPGKEFLVIVFSGECPAGRQAELKKRADPLRLEKISLSRI